jgi:ribosomal protein S18 acetylase RimI-like enzyme
MPTNPSIEIRELTTDDAVIYRDIRLRALKEHPEAFGSSYEESSKRPLDWYVERLKPKNDNFILGAFIEENLLGTVGMFQHDGKKDRHKGVIWGMHTAAEAQGQGIGRALLTAAIERARQIQDIELLQLSVVTKNTGARNFYISCGFTVYGLEPHALKLGDTYLDEEHMYMFLNPKE